MAGSLWQALDVVGYALRCVMFQVSGPCNESRSLGISCWTIRNWLTVCVCVVRLSGDSWRARVYAARVFAKQKPIGADLLFQPVEHE